jgi:hypothetical protein
MKRQHYQPASANTKTKANEYKRKVSVPLFTTTPNTVPSGSILDASNTIVSLSALHFNAADAASRPTPLED